MFSSGSGETVFSFCLSIPIAMTDTSFGEMQAHHHIFHEEHFENLLHHADKMLGMTGPAIALRFAVHTILVIQCHEKGTVDDYIEVRFDTEEADLTCNFDQEKKCESVMIFPDTMDEYNEYIRYLNSAYLHAEGKYCWKMTQGVLTLLADKERLYFAYFRGLELPE